MEDTVVKKFVLNLKKMREDNVAVNSETAKDYIEEKELLLTDLKKTNRDFKNTLPDKISFK